MIVFEQYDSKDEKEMLLFLSDKESFKDFHIPPKGPLYLAKERNETIGAIRFCTVGEQGFVDSPIVKNGVGLFLAEGLIKGVLNVLDLKGINRVLLSAPESLVAAYKSWNLNLYKGNFSEVSKLLWENEQDKHFKFIREQGKFDERFVLFEASLPEFFDWPCEGEKK